MLSKVGKTETQVANTYCTWVPLLTVNSWSLVCSALTPGEQARFHLGRDVLGLCLQMSVVSL
jgi:hypothetical protein